MEKFYRNQKPNSRTIPQGLEQRLKMEEVVPKMACLGGFARMRNNPERGEIAPAVNTCRRCEKNSPFILSCIGKRIKGSCDH